MKNIKKLPGDLLADKIRANIGLVNIKDLLDDVHTNTIKGLAFSDRNLDVVNMINLHITGSELSFVEKCQLIKLGLKKLPICDFCKTYPVVMKHGILLNTCGEPSCVMNSRKSTNFKKYGVEHALASKNVMNKRKNTNLERYGVENVSSSATIKDKRRKTNLERYGVENAFASEEIKDKIKETNLERYGVEYPTQCTSVLIKTKETNLERYGVECVLTSEEIKDKIKETNLERYGAENVFASEEIKDKIKETNLERYGVECVLASKETRCKINESNLERYGTENVFENNNKIRDNINLNRNNDTADRVSTLCPNIKITSFGAHRYVFLCSTCGLESSRSRSYFLCFVRSEINPCPVCNPQCSGGSSKLEKELLEYIRSIYSKEVIENDRTHRLEIDIYLPDLNLGIEFNGVYWHSDEYKDKYYHIDKTKHFALGGIHLVHIWEDEWNNDNEEIKQRLKDLIEGKEINTDSLDWKKYEPSMIISEPQLIIREGHTTYDTGIVLDIL